MQRWSRRVGRPDAPAGRPGDRPPRRRCSADLYSELAWIHSHDAHAAHRPARRRRARAHLRGEPTMPTATAAVLVRQPRAVRPRGGRGRTPPARRGPGPRRGDRALPHRPQRPRGPHPVPAPRRARPRGRGRRRGGRRRGDRRSSRATTSSCRSRSAAPADLPHRPSGLLRELARAEPVRRQPARTARRRCTATARRCTGTSSASPRSPPGRWRRRAA